jgi:glycosyltransferase 2 family protein
MIRSSGITTRFSKLARNRAVQVAVHILLGSSWFIFLARNPMIMKDLPSLADADFRFLAAGGMLTLAVVFVGSVNWWLILRSLSKPAAMLSMVRIHLHSNLGKYIPGYLWQWLGKAGGSYRLGCSAPTIAVAMGLELFIGIATGLGVAICMAPKTRAEIWSGQIEIAGFLHVAGPVILVILASFPFGAAFILKNYRSTKWVDWWVAKARPVLLASAVLVAIFAWLLLGLALWMIGAAFHPLSLSEAPLYVFAMTTSLLAGLAAVFVPVGIGVREGMMVLILSSQMPASQALAVSAVSRLLIIFSEVIAALILVSLGPESGIKSEATSLGSMTELQDMVKQGSASPDSEWQKSGG